MTFINFQRLTLTPLFYIKYLYYDFSKIIRRLREGQLIAEAEYSAIIVNYIKAE